jgi:alkylation response protein AidB-like acyl-CoA dehydrogenase
MITGTRRRGQRAAEGADVSQLNAEERQIVELVGEFVDKEVRPVVQGLEHSNTYPEALIEQMKELGVYGLGIPAPYGDYGVSTP